MIKFNDFVIACDNDEYIKVYHGAKLLAQGFVSSFLLSYDKYHDYTVNKFFSYDDNKGYGSYIEVQLIK